MSSEIETQPYLVLINQSVGPLFLELAEDIATQIGPSWLVTGTDLKVESPELVLRSAPAYNRRNLLTRLISWGCFLIAVIREIWSVQSDALLLIVSNPPMMPWLAWGMNLLRQQSYAVLVYDIYPDILVGLGKLGKNNLLTWVWKQLNRRAYHRASCVITLGQHMAQRLKECMSVEDEMRKIRVIPTWVDVDRFKPIDKHQNPFALKLEQQDKLTVMYSGNIGFTHDISLLIDAAQLLRDQSHFHFLIIGEGPGKPDLVEKANAAGLRNVTFLPFQSEDILPYSLATADVSVVSIGQGVEGLMMPSKTYYSMAVGSALIGISTPPNDLADVITQYNCGVNVLPNDVTGMVKALERFQEEPNYLAECKMSAREAAVEHFSRSVNTQRFAELLVSKLGSVYE